MTPEIAKRVATTHQVSKILSGPARKLTQMRANVWYPDQFDGPSQAADSGKLFSYIENVPVGGVRGVLNVRRNLKTNEWIFDSASYTEDQVKQAYVAEFERVQKLLQKAS